MIWIVCGTVFLSVCAVCMAIVLGVSIQETYKHGVLDLEDKKFALEKKMREEGLAALKKLQAEGSGQAQNLMVDLTKPGGHC